ncbi:MAG: TonB-dependent receptor [Pseudomonadota bacterium]|nr:TonB-dependent receptor [Pseudomonadota bacterium]
MIFNGLTAIIFGQQVYCIEQSSVEEVTVIGSAPGALKSLDITHAPFKAQSILRTELELDRASDLTSILGSSLSGVHLSDVQGNPFQKDLSFRGYKASPLLGVAQGISVFLESSRLNEPLGHEINWDMIPIDAIAHITFISGTTPLYGLNSLGGALNMELKNGFSSPGSTISLSTGSWGRHTVNIERGLNNGTFGYYVNLGYKEEDGWRDLSESDLHTIVAAFSYRGELLSGDLFYLYGNSDLAGNGTVPQEILDKDRDAVFTAPDLTLNVSDFVMFGLDFLFSEEIDVGVDAFYRKTKTDSFNGDASEFTVCDLNANNSLLEGLRPDVHRLNGINENDICGGTNILAVNTTTELQAALNRVSNGILFDVTEVENDELSGTGLLSDSAINNSSDRDQESYGLTANLAMARTVFGIENSLTSGIAYNEGLAKFNSVTELSLINPISRSTRGLGLGTFLDEENTSVATRTKVWDFYLNNIFNLTERFLFSAGFKYFYSDIEISDKSNERPELNGEHQFDRLNLSLGASYELVENLFLYGNYGESSRIPTPIELSCNEGVFQIAQNIAVRNGGNPDDVDFECRLPNAFVADPPLKQVVAKGFEVGTRANWEVLEADISYHYHTNHNDIIFQSTGRSAGLFANVKRTIREGLDLQLYSSFHRLGLGLKYNFLKATFDDNFKVLSPNHPFSDLNGELTVSKGRYLPSLPKHQLKIKSQLRITDQFTVTKHLSYISEQFLRGDESNQLQRLGDYFLLDMTAHYQINDMALFYLKIDNILDSDYESFGVVGEDPRSVIPSITSNRERFLSPGSPRGIWFGMKISM